jgi:cell division septation protein DedD
MAAKRGKNQARRSGRGGSSGLSGGAWVLVGLLIGGLAWGYLHFRGHWGKPGNGLPTPDPQAQAAAPSGDNVVPEPVEKPKPKYDFYTLLPEKEVVIPDAELDAQARAEAAKAAKAAQAALAADSAPGAVAPAAASSQPTPDAAAAIASSDDGKPAASNDGPRYLIQAGAFRGSTEAEALKAQIAMTGEIARVEVAQINGNTVHRVRMGPYPNASALAAAKQALASHGITAQAIKVK